MTFKTILKNPFVWAFVIGIISLHIIRELSFMRKSAPPPLAEVPAWELVDQNSQPFGKKDLLGKVYVVDFFFTSCPTICPKLTQAMKEVYDRFRHQTGIEFVSITVDPDNDTPAVLKDYLEKHDIAYDNWHALTGSKQAIFDVVVNKMKVHVGERQELADGMYDISHMAQLALFDQNGDLRGLFKTDSVELAALVRAARFFLDER